MTQNKLGGHWKMVTVHCDCGGVVTFYRDGNDTVKCWRCFKAWKLGNVEISAPKITKREKISSG